MSKFHVNDAGDPGPCGANIQCPFGGDAQHYPTPEIARQAFELSMASENVPKLSKKSELSETLVKDASSSKPKVERYVHPQGKIVEINSDGSVTAWKNGKVIPTSATAEKLRKGHGAWKLSNEAPSEDSPEDEASKKRKESATSEPIVQNKATEKEVFDKFKKAHSEYEDARGEQHETYAGIKLYNEVNAVAEGRAFRRKYIDGEFKVVTLTKDDGEYYSVRPRPEHERDWKKATEATNKAYEKLENAQTEIEEAGFGHKIPDEKITVRVRTQAQKWLLKNELQGQLSDGQWENTAGDSGLVWARAKVIVDPENVGRNFHVQKDNYQLNAKSLLDIVGDRMVKNVKDKTTDESYDEKKMGQDLKDLRNIFKTKRDSI